MNEKAEERRRLIALRKSFPKKEEKEKLVLRNFLESSIYDECDEIFIYLSMSFEIDTFEIISRSFSDGKTVFVPICEENGKMTFQFIREDEKLNRSSFGILEPERDPSRTALPGERSLIIVPGLAFDRLGNRIGFGGGYYDRFLSKAEAKSAGLCFEEFFLTELPKEEFDIPVNYLVTEKEIYSFQE